MYGGVALLSPLTSNLSLRCIAASRPLTCSFPLLSVFFFSIFSLSFLCLTVRVTREPLRYRRGLGREVLGCSTPRVDNASALQTLPECVDNGWIEERKEAGQERAKRHFYPRCHIFHCSSAEHFIAAVLKNVSQVDFPQLNQCNPQFTPRVFVSETCDKAVTCGLGVKLSNCWVTCLFSPCLPLTV